MSSDFRELADPQALELRHFVAKVKTSGERYLQSLCSVSFQIVSQKECAEGLMGQMMEEEAFIFFQLR